MNYPVYSPSEYTGYRDIYDMIISLAVPLVLRATMVQILVINYGIKCTRAPLFYTLTLLMALA